MSFEAISYFVGLPHQQKYSVDSRAGYSKVVPNYSSQILRSRSVVKSNLHDKMAYIFRDAVETQNEDTFHQSEVSLQLH